MIFFSEAFRQREFVHTFHGINYAFFSINKVSHSNMNEHLLQNAYEIRKKRDLKRDDNAQHLCIYFCARRMNIPSGRKREFA